MEWLDQRWDGNRHFRACTNCQKRYPGCHDHCAEYAADKAAYEEIKHSLKQEKDIDATIKAGANRVNRYFRTNRKGTFREDFN
jgi:hypothetical protein